MRYTNMLERSCTVLFIIGVVLGVPLGAWLWPKETVVVREGTADNPAAIGSVHLMIADGETVKTWNTITHHEAMSVMDLLEMVHATGNIMLTTQNGANGLRDIVAINGRTNDSTSGFHWKYWVNNMKQERAPERYYLRPGDIVVVARVKEN